MEPHPKTGAAQLIEMRETVQGFFVRHTYFLGANDPYSALITTLKAEINEEAWAGGWATLNSDPSRAFDKPKSGRIAVKVIHHLGDAVRRFLGYEAPGYGAQVGVY